MYNVVWNGEPFHYTLPRYKSARALGRRIWEMCAREDHLGLVFCWRRWLLRADRDPCLKGGGSLWSLRDVVCVSTFVWAQTCDSASARFPEANCRACGSWWLNSTWEFKHVTGLLFFPKRAVGLVVVDRNWLGRSINLSKSRRGLRLFLPGLVASIVRLMRNWSSSMVLALWTFEADVPWESHPTLSSGPIDVFGSCEWVLRMSRERLCCTWLRVAFLVVASALLDFLSWLLWIWAWTSSNWSSMLVKLRDKSYVSERRVTSLRMRMSWSGRRLITWLLCRGLSRCGWIFRMLPLGRSGNDLSELGESNGLIGGVEEFGWYVMCVFGRWQ